MRLVIAFLAFMGLGIAGLWTVDLLANPDIDLSAGFFAARNAAGSLFWPHWLAEYGTAAGLLLGAFGLGAGRRWGRRAALLALGALLYTSLNSLGWAFAEADRLGYAVPMLVGLAGGAGSAVYLLRRSP